MFAERVRNVTVIHLRPAQERDRGTWRFQDGSTKDGQDFDDVA